MPPLTTVDPSASAHTSAVTWTDASVVGDRTLDVFYVANAKGCRRLTNVRVAESVDTVTITLYEGADPGDSQPCPDAGVLARVRVPLASPLGRRGLVDGAPPSPEPRPLRRPTAS